LHKERQVRYPETLTLLKVHGVGHLTVLTCALEGARSASSRVVMSGIIWACDPDAVSLAIGILITTRVRQARHEMSSDAGTATRDANSALLRTWRRIPVVVVSCKADFEVPFHHQTDAQINLLRQASRASGYAYGGGGRRSSAYGTQSGGGMPPPAASPTHYYPASCRPGRSNFAESVSVD
jgi:hypothetical protein